MTTRKSTARNKSYNQKTLAKMKARDAGKSSSTIQAVGGSREQQLANAKAQMANIKSMLAEPSTKLTSAQRNTISGQLGTASTELAKLPRAVAPTNAGAVTTTMGETVTPTITPDVAGVANATAGVAGLSAEGQKLADFAAKQEADRIKRAEAQQKESKTLMEKFLGKDGTALTSPTEARTTAWDETGMDVQKYFAKQEAGIKEIESLTNEYNKITAAKDQQIAQTQDAMGSMNFINNQTAQIERNAAPQLNRLSADINAKAATLQAQQGNYAEARSYVNDAVQAATADAKFKFDMYSVFYEENKDNFDRIDSIYADSYKTQMDIAKQEYDNIQAEKQLIGEYMLKYPTAGLKMTDSIEEASKKIGSVSGGTVDLTADMKNYEYAVSQGYEGTFADWVNKGGSESGSNFTDIMQQAIDAGATPEQAAREAATASELTGVPVDQKTLNSWTTYARSLNQTPITPATLPGATISAPTGTYSNISGEQGITLTSIYNSIADALWRD